MLSIVDLYFARGGPFALASASSLRRPTQRGQCGPQDHCCQPRCRSPSESSPALRLPARRNATCRGVWPEARAKAHAPAPGIAGPDYRAWIGSLEDNELVQCPAGTTRGRCSAQIERRFSVAQPKQARRGETRLQRRIMRIRCAAASPCLSVLPCRVCRARALNMHCYGL